MNEYNCNSLKSLPVPDALIKKAAAIPAEVGGKPASVPWYRRTKMIAAAASIALVVTLGMTVYFLFGNKTPIPVLPISDDKATEAASEAATELQTESGTLPTVQAATQPETAAVQAPTSVPTQPATQTATDSKGNVTVITTITQTPVTSTDAPSPASPTQKPQSQPPTAPAVTPTQSPTAEPITQPKEPIEEPEPTVSPWESELAPVGFMIPISSYHGGDVYCRLSGSSGRVMGSPDLFDDSHRVYFTTGGGYLLLSYPLSTVGEPLPADNYTMVFYDADGNDFYISTVYLTNNTY